MRHVGIVNAHAAANATISGVQKAIATPQSNLRLNRAARLWLLAFALMVVALFLIANRGAYRSFFSDDDFDNLSQGRDAPLLYYGKMVLSPKFGGDTNFRPVAALYYWAMPRVFQLHFGPYIGAIHVLHLLNVLLMWLVARSLRVSRMGACAAALLFSFHMGVFSVYWAPMYVFDLLCGTFVLFALLAYLHQKIFLSVICFWLALKSKEVAILLPVALAAYEFWLGGKRWKRLIPFFTITAVIGLEALVFNAHRDNDYSLRFTPHALWTTVQFYAPRITLLPLTLALIAIAAVIALPFVTKNRVVLMGIMTFLAMLSPSLLLPGRLFGAYLYVSLIGLAIAISAVERPAWLAIFFVLWIPWNYRQMRIDRNHELATAGERRTWFNGVAEFVRAHPEPTTFVYAGAPGGMAPYGFTGALNSLHSPAASITTVWVDAPEAWSALAAPDVVFISWDAPKVTVLPRMPDVSYVHPGHLGPLWQLESGWIEDGGKFRWTAPRATARLATLPGAREFELVVNVAPLYIREMHEGNIDVSLNHQHIGTAVMREAKPTTYRFPAPAGLKDPVEVEFTVSPPLPDPNGSAKLYGAPIAAFGFVQ